MDRNSWFAFTFCAFATACGGEGDSHFEEASTGTSRQAVIFGTPSTADQDAVVLIMIGGTSSCTGTLVAPDLVLTARHCVSQEDQGQLRERPARSFTIFRGTQAGARVRSGAAGEALGKRLFVLPATSIVGADIALIALDRKLSVTPAAIRMTGGAVVGEPLTLVGWGMDETGQTPNIRMQRANIPVVSVGADPEHGAAANEFVVNEGSCFGDSGGPYFSTTTKAIVGIVSRGGNARTSEQQPQVTCIGNDVIDIHTDVAKQSALIVQAFAAVGAQPIAEPAPVVTPPTTSTAPSAESPASPPPASTTQATAPGPKKKPPTFDDQLPSSSACSSTGAESPAPSALVFAAFLLRRPSWRKRTSRRPSPLRDQDMPRAREIVA